MAHAKTQELIQYAERRVSENDRLLLNQHFEACAFCAREVRKFEEVLDALKGADLQRAPESVLVRSGPEWRYSTAGGPARPAEIHCGFRGRREGKIPTMRVSSPSISDSEMLRYRIMEFEDRYRKQVLAMACTLVSLVDLRD